MAPRKSTPVPEDKILHPKDANLASTDDWPTFTISHVKVISQQNKELVSLLSANKKNPAKVIGWLEEVEDEQLPLVRNQKYRNLQIEISNVTSYAYAEYEGGEGYGFWAAGQAGWFEIESTVPEYESIHHDMCIATSLLYFIADKYRNSRKFQFTKSELGPYMRRMFREYLDLQVDPARFIDGEDVKEGFHEHRRFLISSMIERQEGLDWTGSPFWNYFLLNFPDDFVTISTRILGTPVSLEPNFLDNKKRKSPSPNHGKEPNKRHKGKLGRPPKNSQTPPQAAAPRTPAAKSTVVLLESASSDDDYEYGNPNVTTRKRKSILQPSGSKYSKKSKKGTGRRRSLPGLADPAESDDQDEEDEEKTPSTEESPITTIKNGEHLDFLTNPPTKRSSRRSSSPPPHFLPRKFLELTLVEFDVPSMEPQGPGDLWTCTFEGCHHRVFKGSTEKGKAKIRDHFGSHKSVAQEKIDLALNESRPYLPVNNLVRRLQAFAPGLDGEDPLESASRKFSAPIRKKY